ncbi:hypothetical protein [Marinilactibacillus kalidii]|uniref:hypothetical protein n=1 Tax=Marinilactibacillus kalidii TaxID=2820274 RepID=UPI001ABDDB67|nr:hypothetical protein [Marinilactibacillus kalidii]
MEEQRNKKMIIELDQSVYEDLVEFCVETNVEKTELMSQMVNYCIKESMNKMDAMRKGYAEMANINLEICSEFDGCESEAHYHI